MNKKNPVHSFVLVFSFIFFSSLFTLASPDRRSMTIDDMLNLVRIDDVLMTPDGSRVFYSERRLNWKTNKYEKSFFMISSEGGDPQPFVGKDQGQQFRISPDGKYLAMIREFDEKPQIFLMRLSGGEAWKLTKHPGKISDYRWSKDSKSIVFSAEEAWKEEEEKEFDLGADPIFVNEGPNGKNHGRWTYLWLTELASGKEKQITREDLLIDDFDISPDGNRILFTARRDNRGNFHFLSELYLVQKDGTELKRLTNNKVPERNPIWAPDGKTFAFHASDDRIFDLKNGYLWIMDPDTGESRKLQGQNKGEIDHLVWTQDGKGLLFNEVHGTNTNLYRINAVTGELEAVTGKTGTFRVEGYSRDLSRIVYSFNDFDTPKDLYTSDLTGENAVRLTCANAWVEKELLLPIGKTVSWESRDGTAIEGILLLPGDYQEGTRIPLILQIHGGPSGYWGNSFEPDLIVYTGMGYAQLGPNPRGSSGYGDSILRGLMGDVGGGEYHDLISGVDSVINSGYVDPGKLGVSGWSWGGVSAGWLITQTNRFKAASVGAGVSNWVGESGPGFNWDVSSWYIGGKHWNNRQEWRNRSAINFVEKVETPTIFLHGGKDQTSSTNQSMVYFDALQERGIATRFIKFPRQGHGIREPRFLRIRMEEEIRWMQKYILGEEWTLKKRTE